MMIIRLPAQRAFFFHGWKGCSLRLSQLLKESSQRPPSQKHSSHFSASRFRPHAFDPGNDTVMI